MKSILPYQISHTRFNILNGCCRQWEKKGNHREISYKLTNRRFIDTILAN